VITLHGAGVGKGIAIGTAFVLQRDVLEIPEYVLPDNLVEDEVTRFRRAIDSARQQLKRIRRHIPSNAPNEIAGFIDAHLLMLEDRVLAEEPVQTIRTRKCNAEWALRVHSESLVDVFDQMKDPYLRNKRTDVQQVVDRVQRNLLALDHQEHEHLSDDIKGRIIVANDLTPADTVLLKHYRVRAFVTNLGGPISHTAILARALGIPAIVGLHGATRYLRSGEEIIVDGKRGSLIIGPDKRILREYRTRQKDIAHRRRELQALRTSPAVTRDRHTVHLYANIELPGDVQAVRQAGATGIGLYRTEFLFMNRASPPSEAEQFNAYMRVIKALGKTPVTIRTVDIGSDKQVDGRAGAETVNPALGLRAVRLCLQDPSVFRPQLRAILRASAYGPVQMMIPMVSSLDELQQVMDIIDDVKNELKHDGQKFNRRMPIGGMIEVPAAAISADLFAGRLDFLSIGTNDLIQYTLAIDRVNDLVNYLYDPLHPSVLRLIHITILAGQRAGIPVAMCGEMAGDVRYTRLLLGMGLRVLSMDAANILEVKKIVRECSIRRLRSYADRVLHATDLRELRALVRELNTQG
jgi:phosphotransferase system enzyme I (PtsI)